VEIVEAEVRSPVHPSSLIAYGRDGWTAPGLRDPAGAVALAELFVRAGAALAEWALRRGATKDQVTEILRRSAAQAARVLSNVGSDPDDGEAGGGR
jgi:hypothetical protein